MSPDPDRRHRVRRSTAVGLAGALLATGVGLTGAASASAKPVYPSAGEVAHARQAVTSAKASVASIEASLAVAQSALEALQTQVQIAAEKYDQAKIELDQRTAAAEAARKQADAARAAADKARADVGQLAVSAYYDGHGMGGLEVLAGARTTAELMSSAASYRIANQVVEQTFERSRASQVVAGVMRRQADAALAQQQAAAARLEAARKAVEAKAAEAESQTKAIQAQRASMMTQLAALQKTSVKLATQRQNGLEAERRARAEAARRAAEARAEAQRRAAERRQAAEAAQRRQQQAHHSSGGSSGSSGSSGGSSSGGSTSPGSGGGSSQGSSSGGQVAASWAQTQLGKWYEWAADGPDTYDCSGLTMRAWQRAGVYLPHSSVAQYAVTEHVSYSDLRPGDLIFYGYGSNPSTIHHVAIYIGGGQMVEAPYTGAQVRISSIYRSGMMPYAGRP